MSKIHQKLTKVAFQCKFDVIVELFVRTQTTAGNPNNTEENSEEIDEKIDKSLKELAEEQQDLQEKFIKMSNKITKLYSLLQKKI